MTARIMKLLLLFSGLALSLSLAAQYPSNSIKSRLGVQTTGDGLVYRGSGAPAYSPGTLFNAWMYLDTTNYTLYMYRNFQWTKLPLVNNGLTLDGSYVQLGGTLVENTQVERSTYTLDFGKISGSNNGYLSFYGTDPHYVGILTTKDGTESGLTIGNKTWGFEVDDGSHVSSISGTRFGFDATYLGALGVSQFKMDSTNFFIRTLPSFASHTAADAGTAAYQMYTLDNSRRIYVNQGAATSDILGTGTTDRSARWTGTNTLGAGSWSDNLTRLQAQVPVQFQSVTTAGLPTGVTGYTVYNTTINGPGWYNGTRWAYALESTFARGTATRIPYFDANGQVTDNSLLTFNSGNGRVTASSYGFNAGTNQLIVPFGSNELAIYSDVSGHTLTYYASGGKLIPFFSDQTLGSVTKYWSQIFVNKITMGLGTAAAPPYSFSFAGDDFRAGMYATGTQASGNIGISTNSTARIFILHNGNIGIGNTAPNYRMDFTSTDAIGFPRGTEAQRPTIASNTTPFRYSTDSIALEYGESVGTWRQLATRAYARSLIAGAANIGNSNLSLTSNRTLTGGAYNFTFTSNLGASFTANGFQKQAYMTVDSFGVGKIIATKTVGSGETGITVDSRNKPSTALGASFGAHYMKYTFSSGDLKIEADVSSNLIEAIDSSGTKTLHKYANGSKTAADLSKTQSNYIAGFATDGTVLDLERKRDTTIFLTADTDYDFSAAVTTAQIASRYNRIIIHMTLTSGVGADKTTTLHAPDANLMQCEILIRGTDNTGTYDNEIAFGTNNAISSDGTNASGYTLAQGQGLHVRVVYNGSAYKYIYY